MSEMKMENSRVPAEKIFNPDLKEAIVTMQEDNSKENVDKMITEVVKAKFILPAKVVPTTQAVTENGQTVMKQHRFSSDFLKIRKKKNSLDFLQIQKNYLSGRIPRMLKK